MEGKRNIPLTLDQIKILLEAMNIYYEKSLRRSRRQEEFRGKKWSIILADQQKLLQYLGMLKNAWEKDSWPESL